MTTSSLNPALFEAAVNSLPCAVMLTDASGNIVFINSAAETLFKTRETTLRKVKADFCTSRIVGKTWDELLADLQASDKHSVGTPDAYGRQFSVADFVFRISANSMYSDSGQYCGQVIEWADYSEAAAIEQEVRNVLSGIANGDLTHRVEGNCDGFFGHLKTSINLTVDKLIDVVQRIKHASDAVAGGSVEICQGNTNLSQHTEEQASSLEETSSSMEQMTSTVQQNAENARQADELAQGAKDRAERGGEVVGKAIEAMSEINSASKRIADIIGVIDEIAFQTNLLALNASVEAARAGDQGRGFAVVASEVRNLAGRSATAAKEIKELIQDSKAKVEQGSRLVDESGKTLEEIISEVQRVTDIVGDISGASLEQAAGIAEVNKAITMMDEMTQQNAALVEQAAAASEAMGDQAAELKTQMNFFKLDESDGPVESPMVHPAKRDTELVSAASKPQLEIPDIPAPESMPFPWYDKDDCGEWEEF